MGIDNECVRPYPADKKRKKVEVSLSAIRLGAGLINWLTVFGIGS